MAMTWCKREQPASSISICMHWLVIQGFGAPGILVSNSMWCYNIKYSLSIMWHIFACWGSSWELTGSVCLCIPLEWWRRRGGGGGGGGRDQGRGWYYSWNRSDLGCAQISMACFHYQYGAVFVYYAYLFMLLINVRAEFHKSIFLKFAILCVIVFSWKVHFVFMCLSNVCVCFVSVFWFL